MTRPVTVTADNPMQRGYTYQLVEPQGQNFDPRFKPELSPVQMLELGVFGGRYMESALLSDAQEYPQEWYERARLWHCHNKTVNLYGVSAGQPLATWRKNGWIDPRDPRGWFEWYCRYWMGRRCPSEGPWQRDYDQWQITRWVNFGPRQKAFLRGVMARGKTSPAYCQALTQWSYNVRHICPPPASTGR